MPIRTCKRVSRSFFAAKSSLASSTSVLSALSAVSCCPGGFCTKMWRTGLGLISWPSESTPPCPVSFSNALCSSCLHSSLQSTTLRTPGSKHDDSFTKLLILMRLSTDARTSFLSWLIALLSIGCSLPSRRGSHAFIMRVRRRGRSDKFGQPALTRSVMDLKQLRNTRSSCSIPRSSSSIHKSNCPIFRRASFIGSYKSRMDLTIVRVLFQRVGESRA